MGLSWPPTPRTAALGAVAVVVIAVGLWLLVTSTGPDAPDPPTPERVAELADAVNTRDPAQLAAATDFGDTDVSEVADAALPPGLTLAIDHGSFQPVDDGQTATVDAVIEGGEAPFDVVLVLAHRDGEWVLIGSTAPEKRA